MQTLAKIGLLNEACARSFDISCVSLFISKLLGYLIILGSVIVKVPQIVKIMQNKSAEGLSRTMFILELVGYAISIVYSISNGYPFNTYGEYTFIALQNFVIIFLVFKYTTNDYSIFGAILVGFISYFYVGLTGILSIEVLQTLQGSSLLIFTVSRLPQIWMNFKTKSTGQLALTTFFLNFAGSLARIFTTLKELQDTIILSGYIVGALLNGTILAQILVYGGGKKKIN